MDEQDKLARFEQCIMPHMDAAYNLARWLAGNDPDAQDVVQEASLRAFKFFGGFRGGDSRSWLLRIVRNSFYDWLHQQRRAELTTPFDEQVHDSAAGSPAPDAPCWRRRTRNRCTRPSKLCRSNTARSW